MVLVVALTVTATPLVAGRLPGVMTPVPFAKTPVRVALDPSVMEVGFTVKLVIEGGGVWVLDDPLPQPVKPARPRLRVMASGVRTRTCLMGFPASRSGRSQQPHPRHVCSAQEYQKGSIQPAQARPYGFTCVRPGDSLAILTRGLR